MSNDPQRYHRHRFPPEIISHAVWLYHRFCLSFRDVEDLLKGQGSDPRWLATDKLRSYSAAHRSVMPSVEHVTTRYANNLAEVSHQPTRQRERQMRKFKSPSQAQRFLPVHGVVRNLFNLGRHRLRSHNYRLLRGRAFAVWTEVAAA